MRVVKKCQGCGYTHGGGRRGVREVRPMMTPSRKIEVVAVCHFRGGPGGSFAPANSCIEKALRKQSAAGDARHL